MNANIHGRRRVRIPRSELLGGHPFDHHPGQFQTEQGRQLFFRGALFRHSRSDHDSLIALVEEFHFGLASSTKVGLSWRLGLAARSFCPTSATRLVSSLISLGTSAPWVVGVRGLVGTNVVGICICSGMQPSEVLARQTISNQIDFLMRFTPPAVRNDALVAGADAFVQGKPGHSFVVYEMFVVAPSGGLRPKTA